uniref:F-box domain-containing protein n=1 Tax=Ditylenchus dipsaci TaxID=166011 RepID=A0A915E7J2_9BILA
MTEAEVLAEAKRDDRRMQLCEADKDECGNLTPRSASPSSLVRSLASPVSDDIEDAIFNGKMSIFHLLQMSTARKAKFSIIYCGISGDNANNAQDGNLAWSNRMSLHSRSKLFADFNEIGFVKLLEGAPADKIRKWEWEMVYSKNLIDKRVTEYFEDYPSNDDYSINILSSEYPYKRTLPIFLSLFRQLSAEAMYEVFVFLTREELIKLNLVSKHIKEYIAI